jgi:hypothetical protein
METSIKAIAEAFSRHSFEIAYPHLHDDIRWNLIGETTLVGKENVKAACTQSSEYLSGVSTTFRKFQVVAEGNCVVIDSVSEYCDADKHISVVYSCDIYEFDGGKISVITSYCIEGK